MSSPTGFCMSSSMFYMFFPCIIHIARWYYRLEESEIIGRIGPSSDLRHHELCLHHSPEEVTRHPRMSCETQR